ncbi:MAG: hypothetical protein K1Y36_08855 [Blastocatellia bacterium]|nr:hypothetical protein [Blastocatellia bacterium]
MKPATTTWVNFTCRPSVQPIPHRKLKSRVQKLVKPGVMLHVQGTLKVNFGRENPAEQPLHDGGVGRPAKHPTAPHGTNGGFNQLYQVGEARSIQLALKLQC